MLIANIASGTTVLTAKEIESRAQALFFDISFGASGLTKETLADAQAMITAAVGSAKIKITRQGQTGSKPVLPEMNLSALLEASTNNDGVIRIDYDGTTIRLRATVELSLVGALATGDANKLMLTITGKVSASTYNIYALDYPATAGEILVYEELYINQSSKKDIDTRGCSVVQIPVDSITEMEVRYNTGQQVTMGVEEVKQRLFDAQDTIICMNGRAFYGYATYALFNTEDVLSIGLTLSSAGNVYLIKRKAI